MGFEGANVLFDTWVHPLMMGLEEHLLGMFRGDFEFHDGRRAVAPRPVRASQPAPAESPPATEPGRTRRGRCAAHAGRQRGEHRRDPGLGRRRREGTGQDPVLRARQGPPQHRALRAERGVATITVETLYDAKAHFSR